MHVTDPMLRSVAKQVGETLWGVTEDKPEPAAPEVEEGPEKAN